MGINRADPCVGPFALKRIYGLSCTILDVISSEPCIGEVMAVCRNLSFQVNRSTAILCRIRGDWTLMGGRVGAAVEEIVRPFGDFITYDFLS